MTVKTLRPNTGQCSFSLVSVVRGDTPWAALRDPRHPREPLFHFPLHMPACLQMLEVFLSDRKTNKSNTTGTMLVCNDPAGKRA